MHDPCNEETVFTKMARRASLTLRKRRLSRLDSSSTVPTGSQAMYRESVSSITYADEKMGGELTCRTCLSFFTCTDEKPGSELG